MAPAVRRLSALVPPTGRDSSALTAPVLYRRLLGPAFDALPPALRAFHGAVTGGSAMGILRVRRGRGIGARALARLLRLPPPGDRVDTVLRVTVDDDRELWQRTFAGWPLRSTQSLEHGRLVERFGAATVVFEVSADQVGMRFRSVSFAWLGMRLPRWLVIDVAAQLIGHDTHWDVRVEIRAPRVGLITSYEGRMTPALP